MTASTEVTYELTAGVAVLTLNRAASLNALTLPMVERIIDGARRADREAKVLLIRAEGRAFCAGRDLGDARPGEEDGGQVLAEVFNPMVRAVDELDLPTVAAVQGAALGAGLGLALACDVILAADTAKIGSPFASIGAVLDSGAHRAFVERLGPAVAMDLIYSGRFLSGVEAAAAGLVSRALPADELDQAARAYAAALAAGPTLAFRESKRLVRELSERPFTLAETLDREAQAQSRASRTKDYAEGFTAFLERRPPRFRGE